MIARRAMGPLGLALAGDAEARVLILMRPGRPEPASACSALFTRPTLSLNMNLNWKPTSSGENIMGNIMMVLSARWPRVGEASSPARSGAPLPVAAPASCNS